MQQGVSGVTSNNFQAAAAWIDAMNNLLEGDLLKAVFPRGKENDSSALEALEVLVHMPKERARVLKILQNLNNQDKYVKKLTEFISGINNSDKKKMNSEALIREIKKDKSFSMPGSTKFLFLQKSSKDILAYLKDNKSEALGFFDKLMDCDHPSYYQALIDEINPHELNQVPVVSRSSESSVDSSVGLQPGNKQLIQGNKNSPLNVPRALMVGGKIDELYKELLEKRNQKENTRHALLPLNTIGGKKQAVRLMITDAYENKNFQQNGECIREILNSINDKEEKQRLRDLISSLVSTHNQLKADPKLAKLISEFKTKIGL